MRSLWIGAALVLSLLVSRGAHAQQGLPMDENTPDLCSDGVDNDNNHLIDCQDPRCFAMPNCVVPGEKPLMLVRPRPKQEVVAGALLIVSGLALVGVSAGVIYETETAHVLAQSPGYFFGASLAGSSLTMIIMGAYYLHSGIRRHDNERRLGLELSDLRIEPNLTVTSQGGGASATLHF